jgi:hypothetical protein
VNAHIEAEVQQAGTSYILQTKEQNFQTPNSLAKGPVAL